MTDNAIRTHRWKYSVSAPSGDSNRDAGSDVYVEEFLYDLQADPHELNNPVGVKSFQAVADEIRERLIRRMQDAGEAAPSIQSALIHRDSGARRVGVSELRKKL